MPDDWTWLVNLGALAGASLAAYEAFKGRRHARDAQDAANLAADRSEPTSNGFARNTAEALARIERISSRNSQLLTDHIADHARAHLTGRDRPE